WCVGPATGGRSGGRVVTRLAQHPVDDRVVAAVPAPLAAPTVDLLCGGRQRHLLVDLRGGVGDQAHVLDEDGQRGADVVEGAVDHASAAVAEHEGGGRSGAEHLVDLLQVQAHRVGERERLPGGGPTTGAFAARASSRGRTTATSASAPPTMISRSPVAARAAPPETGASTTCAVTPSSRAAAASIAAGPTVDMTSSVVDGFSTSTIPSSPVSTDSSCAGVATMTTTTSAAPAASRAEAAGAATSARASRAAGSRSKTVTGNPASAAVRAIGAP